MPILILGIALVLMIFFIGYRTGQLEERWEWREGRRKSDWSQQVTARQAPEDKR